MLNLSELFSFLPEGRIWTWTGIILSSLLGTGLIKLTCRVLSIYLRRYTSKTLSIWDDVFVDLIDGLRAWIVFAWLLFLFSVLMDLSLPYQKVFKVAVIFCSLYQFGLWGLHIIKSWSDSALKAKAASDPASAAAMNLLKVLVQASFLVMLFLIGLSNVGINISALLAGLGVGGIAVALAAQNVLGDLLASLSIAFDKPFVSGDFIVVGADKGTVEHIGVSTTRLRSLSGEELILPNRDLIQSRVQNFKRMWQRRVVQKFGVEYSTDIAALEAIPSWIKEIFSSHEGQLKLDRCNLASFGESSLDFELVFFVLDPDYNTYMDLQEQVLLAITRRFTKEKINFAFPSRSIYLEKAPPEFSPKSVD